MCSYMYSMFGFRLLLFLFACVQPYDLPEAEPPILAQGGRHGTPLSATGIQHWRTVLSMLSGSSQSTKTPLPPSCHPPQEPRTKQLHYYSTEDHKRDVLLRSTFFPANKKVILTPLYDPPRVEKQRQILKEPSRNISLVPKTMDLTSNTRRILNQDCSGSAVGRGSVGGGEIESEREAKSCTGAESESFARSELEQTSFTSYQIPILNQALDTEAASATSDHIESESKSELVASPGQSIAAQRERNPPMNVRW